MPNLSTIDARSSVRSAPAKSGTEDLYWPQLDGLRAVAFFQVFLYHAGMIPGAAGNRILASLNQAICCGNMAVDVFFVISGYLITSLLLREKARFGSVSFPLFFARRTLRIWPLYYFVLVSGCIVLPLVMRANPSQWLQFLLTQFLPLALFIGNFSLVYSQRGLISFSQSVGVPIDGLLMPFWTLCIEEQFYLAWPLTVSKLKSPKLLLALLGVLAFISVGAGLVLHNISLHSDLACPRFLYQFNTLSHMQPLIAGATFALMYQHFPWIIAALMRRVWALFAGLCVVCYFIYRYSPMNQLTNSIYSVSDLSLMTLACSLIVLLTLEWKPFKRFFSLPALTHIGKITYGMYVVHYFVLALVSIAVSKYFAGGCTTISGWLLKSSLAFIITYVLARLSWALLESRFNRMRSRYRRTA